jgi:hypothetical protein
MVMENHGKTWDIPIKTDDFPIKTSIYRGVKPCLITEG